MKRFLAVALAVLPLAASASLPIQMSTDEMARKADHIAIGRVVKVDLIDKSERVSNDPKARTGPCMGNTIRLHVKIDKVLATTAKEFPPQVLVPLDSFMHYSLGQVQSAHEGPALPALYLLKGPSFLPVAPGKFHVGLDEQKKIMRIYATSPRAKYIDDTAHDDTAMCRNMEESMLKLQPETQEKTQ
ncbi:hypothetical protein RBA41_10425 [Massilia sp. CCM 9210]|uniref:hypothetical protein n=1 Tax=Massilia scottii TaxID=3057166 RepID=UPI0027969C6E|nr:hypothetical protein [Massilia sp. CCM 9210]MDQ1813720.1 hypothetical protein [Massilia sp. CCM 9210]